MSVWLRPQAAALDLLGQKGSAEGADAVMAAVSRAEAPGLLKALIERGVEIEEARWVGADLESIFFTETGSVQAPESIHAG